jgi:MscS family membrane protein
MVTARIGVAILYLLTALFNRVLTLLLTRVRPRTFGQSDLVTRGVVPAPARLLIVSLLSRWFLASLPFSLFMRQIGFSVASLVTISSLAWLLMHVAGEAERYIQRAFPGAGTGAAKSLLRLVRRAFDVLVIFAALLATLQHFGIDPTVALAGLGVGGIAVALAAQKTLENVIAGASLIFDQAVRVGDFLRMGQTTGTVEHIGLRSTRIRTLDRTVVSVPNSQIANASLETLSSRDQFWFHPIVGLRYETTSEQLRDVVESIRRLLSEHESVVRESVRVRFIRLGAFSLDVEVVAYINARDWPHFLEIQEHLLFQVIEIVERAGTAIAFPSQTLYVESADPSSAAAARSLAGKVPIDR